MTRTQTSAIGVLISALLLSFGASADVGGVSPARGGAPGDPPRDVVSAGGRVVQVVRNPNDCAPSSSIAVWPEGQHTGAPLGYQCVDITR